MEAILKANEHFIWFEMYIQGPPNNSFFFWKMLKKTTEYFLKFLIFIWKYNPFG